MKSGFIALIAPLTCSLMSSLALAQGFEKGNDFTIQPIDGQVSVTCHDSSEFRSGFHVCSTDLISPEVADYFVGPNKIEADEVTLSTESNGKLRSKTHKYDGQAGRSKKRFNLWISTLLQRPLLREGTNTVRYELKKNGAAVMNGSFVAKSQVLNAKRCPSRHYQSFDGNDCRSSFQICDRYFRDLNYCQ